MKKKEDLDEICRHAHMDPDQSTSQENLMAIIDSGRHKCFSPICSQFVRICTRKRKWKFWCKLGIYYSGKIPNYLLNTYQKNASRVIYFYNVVFS